MSDERRWSADSGEHRASLREAARDLAVSLLRRIARAVGLEVRRARPRARRMGVDPFADIRMMLAQTAHPVVFDVGANVGQSVQRFSDLLPGCSVHAFEPSPSAFAELRRNTRRFPNLTLVNAGVGAAASTRDLIENEYSNMSSFLRPGESGWGSVVRRTSTEIICLDEYCGMHGIDVIDLLKIDTQGYELEVLAGARRLMTESRIRLIYLEITFADLYEELPPLDLLYRQLVDHDYQLVAFYDFVVQNQAAGWCDGLFKKRTP